LKRNPTPGPLRRLLLTLATLAVLLGLLSIPWRGARPPAPPRVAGVAHGSGPLRAGAAARPIELGDEPLIAGFPRLRWRAEGVRDRAGGGRELISARALVLSEAGCTVALVSAEILLVPGALTEAVRARVAGLGIDAVIVGATHTHAGPGGWWDSLPGELGAAGPYDQQAFDRLAASLAAAVRDAHAALAPATVSVARGRAEELVRNRTGAGVDGRLLAVRVARLDGAPVAELVSFAAHPTLLGGANRQLSGDWVGRLLADAPRGTRLFFQGASGDQSVRYAAPEGVALVEAYGQAVGAAVDALPGSTPVDSPALAVASATVPLPPMSPGAVPRLLRPAAATLLGGTFPAAATVTALRLGGALLVFTPAEPVEEVGRRWRDLAGADAEVLSLTGDYVGYVDTAARFDVGAGEARRSYYGPGLAARLEAAVGAAAAAAAATRPGGGDGGAR
jgi:neutral ceramidase